ncbi:MAG: phosphodiester glycosidase family protein [Actinobacteria bacterium]|nr:phosphodiester glycosidase family protein [Actinomycetota bacterium]
MKGIKGFPLVAVAVLLLASCSQVQSGSKKAVDVVRTSTQSHKTVASQRPVVSPLHPTTTKKTNATVAPSNPPVPVQSGPSPLPTPPSLTPFSGTALAQWTPAGRSVNGTPAVYETTMLPPGGSQPAGIAWMDTNLLSARLYSGSGSPGGGPYQYTAPIQPAQAATLVAAFNGGFYMSGAHGGYYTEGKLIDPLVNGAASFVIYANGDVNIGAWGTDVTMAANVVSVRQNLIPLVANGSPTPMAATANWQAWGVTCGLTSCAPSVPGVESQWRSGVGITGNGALVYVQGPSLDPLQLADLLVRAGAVRGMELDINPDWPIFATYNPPTPNGMASPANGAKLLPNTVQGPWTFFEAWWARDFITMSAR